MGFREIIVIMLIFTISLSSNTCEGLSEDKLVRIKSHLLKSQIGDKEISVVATCASSDNTIGPVTLHPYSNNMEFKFKTNAFGETVFRCTFNINNVEHKFVIFNNQRGIYGENCWILADGVDYNLILDLSLSSRDIPNKALWYFTSSGLYLFEFLLSSIGVDRDLPIMH
ncbi:hypothetical protein G4B88_007379 [Cannabis sativa]|uniref:S-protein homolog n=1 Tax=Cannabis sativa TaxID=3483 RepID=A0A7J6EPA7_CANSA|nr:hypothetical protein G4B88_007379 [Cannabis sativa]